VPITQRLQCDARFDLLQKPNVLRLAISAVSRAVRSPEKLLVRRAWSRSGLMTFCGFANLNGDFVNSMSDFKNQEKLDFFFVFIGV
jgi:hypothetical protein